MNSGYTSVIMDQTSTEECVKPHICLLLLKASLSVEIDSFECIVGGFGCSGTWLISGI